MADCELLDGCIFFQDKMASMPASADIFKRQYCNGDNAVCGRYMVFKALGNEKVPVDLFPNDADRAKELIAKG